MIQVEFPEPQFRIRKEKDINYIFDVIRKKWLVLTEEEWVRQNFISYLLSVLHYPSTVIALEKEIRLNDLKKRFDILIYDKHHLPWMMVECKGHRIELSEEVLQQVLRYNISVPVQYIVITNGAKTIGWEKSSGSLHILDHLPLWEINQ